VKDEVVSMEYFITQEQLADILTKALKLDTFCKLVDIE